MTTHRDCLLGPAGAGALLALDPRAVFADQARLITRAIPRVGGTVFDAAPGYGASEQLGMIQRVEGLA